MRPCRGKRPGLSRLSALGPAVPWRLTKTRSTVRRAERTVTAYPTCSLIIVNYNGVRHLQDCLPSLQHLIYPPERLDLIMIENGSDMASIDFVRQMFPAVRPFVNTENNFAKALNLGVSLAQGDYIGFLNNDVVLESRWLEELVALLEVEKTAGAAGGKILFKDGRINSVGHRRLPNFYFEDLGFNEEDRGQYETMSEVVGLCWAAVLFRRACLEDVGRVDEDFVMYLEDVDYAMRCRARGWRLLYTPRAMAYHEFHGSSSSPNIPYYFYNRNRFLYVAKHVAEALPHAITTSHFFSNHQYEQLFDCIPMVIKKLIDHNQIDTVRKVLIGLCEVLEPIYGSEAIDQLLARMEVVLGLRKMSIGVYSPALHTMADEQEYICKMGSAVQERFDLTYIVHEKVDPHELEMRYGLDLSKCRFKILHPLLRSEDNAKSIDSDSINPEVLHRLHAISEESMNYDFFINTDISQDVIPLSPCSIAICRSSDHIMELPWSAQEYTFVFADSKHTIKRLQERWGFTHTYLLYPARESDTPPAEKGALGLTAHGRGDSLQEGACHVGRDLAQARFAGRLTDLFGTILKEYSTIHLPDPVEVAKIAFNVRISADPRSV